jgi:uncharacterized protein (TIGR03067 family)
VIRATKPLLVAVALLALVAADTKKTDAERLAGVWLVEAASQGNTDAISRVWTSTLTIDGEKFSLSKFMTAPHDLKGKFTLGSSKSLKTIDLKTEEFDLTPLGAPVKLPASMLRGIYKLDGDRLTVRFPMESDGKRPTAFDGVADKEAQVTLVRAPAGFKGYPKEVTVKVSTPDGKLAVGVSLLDSMSSSDPRTKNNAAPEWRYSRAAKVGEDGTAKVKFEDLRFTPITARDEKRKLMAIAAPTPAALAKGEVAITLKPEARVMGTISCPEMTKAGKPLGWTNVYAMSGGRRLAMSSSKEGKFEFLLPPGRFTFHAYGTDFKGKFVPIDVPEGKSELTLDPIELIASRLTVLQGRPAPELTGVVGWKGQKVSLAGLKGKYVLLDFWGYWCGPCVGVMPVLIDIHEKYHDKGFVVVGVHLDADGEVDTAAKLDEKIAGFKKKLWKGKDLPFPVALTSGRQVGEGDARKHVGAVGDYGIHSFPTTVLIDPEGKVVGKVGYRDIASATKEIDKLLEKMRKQ